MHTLLNVNLLLSIQNVKPTVKSLMKIFVLIGMLPENNMVLCFDQVVFNVVNVTRVIKFID